MSKNKQGFQNSQQGGQFNTKVTEQAGCGKVLTETFTPNDPTVSCTRCGAESHDPSLLCSPSTTIASSTPMREASSGSSSGSSYGGQSSGGSSGGFSGSGSKSKKR